MFVQVGFGVGSRPVEVGNHLLVQLVDRFDGELPVGERLAEGGTEAEHGPCDLMRRDDDVGKLAGRSRPAFTALILVASNPERARET